MHSGDFRELEVYFISHTEIPVFGDISTTTLELMANKSTIIKLQIIHKHFHQYYAVTT